MDSEVRNGIISMVAAVLLLKLTDYLVWYIENKGNFKAFLHDVYVVHRKDRAKIIIVVMAAGVAVMLFLLYILSIGYSM